MVDWAALDFRKLYLPFSQSFERLPYAARAMGADIIRRCDREGRIIKVTGVTPVTSVTSQLVDDVAFQVRAHSGEETWIRGALEALLKDNYLVIVDGWLKIRNYVEAQKSSSAERMARKRQRESGKQPIQQSSHSDESDASDVTPRNGSHSDESDEEEKRREENDPPTPNSIRELVRQAYAQGALTVLGGQSFSVQDSEADVVVRVVADSPRWCGLRGQALATAIRNSAAAYVRARRAEAKFERGFTPTKWAEWLRTEGAGQRRSGVSAAERETKRIQLEYLRKQAE